MLNFLSIISLPSIIVVVILYLINRNNKEETAIHEKDEVIKKINKNK
jgi:hypothetical protein